MKRFSILFFVLLLSVSAFSQKVSISGEVIDKQNEPVIGATVKEHGTTNGVVTDIDGKFSIQVGKNAVFDISYIGYKTKSVRATQGMKIVLEDETNLLEEVVAIGYGSVKRKDVTTAVSTVSTEDLDTRPIVSAAEGMQGKAAGLQISQASGQPGASPTVRVRGTTSLNGSNSPLYVVDGVPLTSIDFLSADDIADMQVLKDASSAAIYGSRAANGVIIINTKQGKNGVAKISFNAHYAWNKVCDHDKVLNTWEYKDLMNDIGTVKLPDGLTNHTDWAKEVYRTGNVQDYQLSVTNGTDKLRYYVSGGYVGENGVLKMSNFKRYNFRASVENEIKSWLKFNGNIAYSDYTYLGTDITTGAGANRGGVIPAIVNTPTYAPVWDPDHPGQYYNNFYGVNISSPSENLARSKDDKSRYDKMLATGKITVTPIKELNFTSSLTFDRENGNTFNFLDPHEIQYGRDTYGTGYDERYSTTVFVWDNVLNWNKQFGKHHFDAMAGSSYTQSKYSHSYISGSNYADSDIKTLNAANKISWTGTGTSASEWAILSYFARLQYNWSDTYMFTANMRADGSSKLAPGHRWGIFPSFSGAWRISNEKFMKNIRWIDDLKLRGGWGQTGNQSGLGDYSYLAEYNINRIQWFGAGYDANALPTRSQTTLSNPELTWETTNQTDIGLDLTVLGGRLTFYADYYYKLTKDMLMTITLPAGSAAARDLRYNGGEIENKGFEFSVSSKNLVGKLKWNTDFNISFNRNKLKKLMLTQVYYSANTTDYVNQPVVRNMPGKPLGTFWGYISDGVNPETGELKYRDVNHDGVISASDRTDIGDPNPDFTFGMTNTLSYKGFNLSVLLQGSYGNDIYNVSRMETEGMYDGKNQTTKVLERWRVPGQITSVPKAKFQMFNSTYFIEDGSYLRVKDISLSYDVPKYIISKFGISRLQPYISATNLITFTNYSGNDPEVNQYGNSGSVQGIDWGTYPMSKSFVVGLKLEF
ncbi:SusC/RagA family TonB-linked outer membrane protein [Prevotella sp.]|uniref:SusC/RagA family TonB-linked outer membrane protein n=1 Tax=Prevotella sp. TaxID=59823 RepID=UPI0026488E37|nr:TonB-dependent receptor [Prevotella sp.]MDN5554040.1 TonB-dependent receptor [Prevotella sp.]